MLYQSNKQNPYSNTINHELRGILKCFRILITTLSNSFKEIQETKNPNLVRLEIQQINNDRNLNHMAFIEAQKVIQFR